MANIVILLIFVVIYAVANRFINNKLGGGVPDFDEVDYSADSEAVEIKSQPKRRVAIKPQRVAPVSAVSEPQSSMQRVNSKLGKLTKDEFRKGVIMSEILKTKF